MTEKHQKTGEEQAVQGVDDLTRIARVVHSHEEAIGRTKEARDCRQRDVEQGLQLLLGEFDWSGLGDFRWSRKEFGDDFGVCSLLSMIHLGIVGRCQLSLDWRPTQFLPRLCPECSSRLLQKMENWLFNRPKDYQREKIFDDVFVNGCFGGTSCAKNFRSSELDNG